MPQRKGLANANNETRQRVAQAGGNAPHKSRGLETADPDKRKQVARLGGLARKRK